MYKVIQLHEIMHLKKNVTFKVKQRRTGIYIQLRHVLNSAVHVTAFEIEILTQQLAVNSFSNFHVLYSNEE